MSTTTRTRRPFAARLVRGLIVERRAYRAAGTPIRLLELATAREIRRGIRRVRALTPKAYAAAVQARADELFN